MSSTLHPSLQRHTKAIILLFFAAYLLIGVVWSADYGVSTDESFEANTAQITIDYVTGANDRLLTYEDRHYGALFALLLQAASSPFSDSRDNLLARHLVTFLFFYLSTILFYKLSRKLGYSSLFSLLGTALLILNPQIF
jgi:preprotein translocase subunit SecG